MTAPTLTPEEVEEVSRFGIHHDDVLRDMEEHQNDEPACVRGDAPATTRHVTRCCGASKAIICEHHHLIDLARMNRRLESGGTLTCNRCGKSYHYPDTAADIVEAVTL